MPISFEPSLQLYKRLTLLAALLMLLPLPIMQYVGEEGLMAIKSYEMHVRGDWLHPSILGSVWPHSPLWHWPVMIISNLIGWEHVDIAIRLVSVTSSWISACVVGFTASWLFRETPHANWLGALIYLSMGEIAFWYGWLGYLDATFGLFVFSSIVALWRAISEESLKWLLISLLLVSLAFLTKNITAYALFGLSGFVLLWRCNKWHLLKSPAYIVPGVAALAVPWLWQSFIVPSGANTATTTINDVLRNFIGYGILNYLNHWITFPLLFASRALPVSLFIIWLWLRRKQQFFIDQNLTTLLLILFVCLLPFWLSANATPRYLVPFYGLFALLLTGLTLQLSATRLRQSVTLIALFILLKIPYSFVVLPYIKDWRPERNVKLVAEEVIKLTENAPLLSQNDVASGLAVTAYIDVWRQDRQPVTWYRGKVQNVYILAEVESPHLGKLIKSWRLRGDNLYLYWKGE
ncbi:Dolichyl-phosphate-mannose-protein mannosyltransferase [Mariprofundus ferrinatatus]|uniref:Dolichyl-phosphate-mannose-protein mannosyltransferase n=1 Tax=Mariprofundus ferrinatatus TaxID=1921087 RepID=A0A2K8L440_9PROT|nr:glycosyltransferase family 39 protein [Mariprofundus ferrinatatus]ATX82057.1 Dolichyl-phosphate-mannose-protein mannosyltransferase [Mariprofundus ferrinatatus]